MKEIVLLAAIALQSLGSPAQNVLRHDNESADQFVKRIKPDTVQLAHPVITTRVWDIAAEAIIAFYGYDDGGDSNTGFNKIWGHLYFGAGKGNYRDIFFGPIEEDGGYPEILSVFFANADKDEAKELIVLCKYDQRHYDYEGELYTTFIFDNPGKDNTLTFFEKLSNRFAGCECGWRDGKSETAKYKTAQDIKAALRETGF